MNLIYGLIPVLLLIEIRAQYDRYLIEDKEVYILHWSRGIIQASIMFATAALTNVLSEENWLLIIPQTLSYFFLFWLLFDIRLNILRGRHWLYVPLRPDHRSAKTDRFLRWANLTGLRMLNVKLLLLFLSTGVYYYLLT